MQFAVCIFCLIFTKYYPYLKVAVAQHDLRIASGIIKFKVSAKLYKEKKYILRKCFSIWHKRQYREITKTILVIRYSKKQLYCSEVEKNASSLRFYALKQYKLQEMYQGAIFDLRTWN